MAILSKSQGITYLEKVVGNVHMNFVPRILEFHKKSLKDELGRNGEISINMENIQVCIHI